MLSVGPNGPAAAPRILVVDDDPNLLVVLAEQLRADGYEVATARDGVEALRRLDHAWPDLLVIDMMMPRMDGLTLAREVKGRADLPIIVLSAIDTGDNKADLLDEVAEDYVTKPYHYPELRARINRVLRRLGRQGPSPEPRPRAPADPRAPSPRGGRGRQARATDADRVAAALRPGRQPRQDGDDRDAPRPGLGRDRGCRSVLRLGDDAPAAPEGRARPEPSDPPADGPRRSATGWSPRRPAGPNDGPGEPGSAATADRDRHRSGPRSIRNRARRRGALPRSDDPPPIGRRRDRLSDPADVRPDRRGRHSAGRLRAPARGRASGCPIRSRPCPACSSCSWPSSP